MNVTSEQAAKYAAMEQRVLAALSEHGPQTIYQLWARIALPEIQAMAEGARQDVTSCTDVAAAFWRLLERQAVKYTTDQRIALTESTKTPS